MKNLVFSPPKKMTLTSRQCGRFIMRYGLTVVFSNGFVFRFEPEDACYWDEVAERVDNWAEGRDELFDDTRCAGIYFISGLYEGKLVSSE